jgi:N-acetylmuramoyl-L-alanine amidase
MRRSRRLSALLAAAWAVAACASGRSGPALLSSESDARARVPLPPVAPATGPLKISVVYPREGQLLTARDSNFIFGSVGKAGATLTVNGVPVPTLPNGAFLAFLPVPAGLAPRYELFARAGADTARAAVTVRLPAPPPPPGLAGLAVTADTVSGDSLLTSPPDSLLTAPRDSLPRPPVDTAGATSAPPAARVDTGAVYVTLGAPGAAPADTDLVVIGRPTPGGTYKWFFLPGTVVPVRGRSGDWVRVGLDERLDVWVAAADATPLPPGTPAPARVARNVRVVPAERWVDVVIPMTARPPHQVEELDRAIALTLFGTTANTDIVQQLAADPLVRHVSWTQEGRDRARYVVHLARAPYGYLALWTGGAFVLRVRRPPAVRAAAPLRGLTIAVDPGHPPIGATGPTGLYEAVPTLAVGVRVQRLLEARGARVVMTRVTPSAVPLGDRPIIARRADAHALVSIHLNALPDGVNPFTAHGTGTYWFHPHAVPLARAMQRALVRRMGLRDLGIYYDNLALARPTWMPAVLAEGAFIMIPEQEAALRTPEYQEAYARGVVEGLERYFAGLAGEAAADGR